MSLRAIVPALALILGLAGLARAQPLGSFTWQLQPFCNRVTVTVTQNGGIYTLDGYDDQCGAPQRAPLVGMATPNPDGSIGLGFHIATSPGGKTVSVEARISLATIGGPWTDSAGNSGTMVLNGQAAGAGRPAPPASGVTVNSVTSASIVDGSIAAADVNSAQVQLRLVGACQPGQFMIGSAANGTVTCSDGVSGGDAGNAAFGIGAMPQLTTGASNLALGPSALASNQSGSLNVAVGPFALSETVSGGNNVAVGVAALGITPGTNGTAVGHAALSNATGSNNTALGYRAGVNVRGGTFNIHIGASTVGDLGDTGVIRIGIPGGQTRAFVAGIRGVTTATPAIPVLVGTDGQLGTVSSSRRFKQDIADMGDFSGRLAALRPVTFRYIQPAADGTRPLDFGLVAEEVAEVFPELAVRGADGQIETVAYHKLPTLLLNELQRQQRVIDTLVQRLQTLETARERQ